MLGSFVDGRMQLSSTTKESPSLLPRLGPLAVERQAELP